MKTIKTNLENTLIIKNSKFITKYYKISTIEEINNILMDLKIKYKDASHICYAYIIDDLSKYSDDSEPNNTAGFSIYNVLNHHSLNYVLCVVIRYFGGIKLGIGPLAKAYKTSASILLIKENIVNLVNGYQIEIIIDYNKEKILNIILKDAIYLKKEYLDNIYYLVNVKEDLLVNLNNHNISYNIIKKIKLEI
ncbi:MAG: YigZ family protein [Bacilli bacterium]